MHWIDPASLPATTGVIGAYLYNAAGDADGFLLEDGQQVHLPPHLSAQLLRKTRVGDKVSVRGVKPRGAPVVAAVAVASSSGAEIVDDGPHAAPHPHRPPRATRPVELHTKVTQTLYAPKGEVCGAVLAGGEIVRMEPRHNAELGAMFRPGAAIGVWGESFSVRGQVVIDLTHVAAA